MKILCKLGFHEWKEWIIFGRRRRECKRCKSKDVWLGGLVNRWQPEE